MKKRLTEIVFSQLVKLNPPARPDEVVYQVTFQVIGMVSSIAGQLFEVNGEIA